MNDTMYPEANYSVTCHTTGCGNAEQPVFIIGNADQSALNVVCGPCMLPITDIVIVVPDAIAL